jgi:predicted secreted protein
MKRILPAVPAALAAMLAASASAGDEPITYDRVGFAAAAEEQVSNDTLVAVIYVQREGQQQAGVADAVNQEMRWALDAAKRAAGVKVQTLGYTTSPVYRNQTITGWRARQSLRLESREAGALTKLLGTLQERLAVESVSYTVSPEARAAVEERLIAQAIAAFEKRAALIAKESSRDGYRLVRMDIATGDFHPPPIPFHGALMRAEAAVAEPAVAPGEQTLTVTVSGTIELNPAQ